MNIKYFLASTTCGLMLMTAPAFAQNSTEQPVENTQQNAEVKVIEQASDAVQDTVNQAGQMTKSAVEGLDNAGKELQKHALESLDYAQTNTTKFLNSAKTMITTGEVDENMTYALSVVGGAAVGTAVASVAGVGTISSIAIIATGGVIGSMIYANDAELIDADKPEVTSN